MSLTSQRMLRAGWWGLNMMTQAEILREKYTALRASGVRDIKFCFGPLAEETSESVCASINEALDAISCHEYDDLPLVGDSHRPA